LGQSYKRVFKKISEEETIPLSFQEIWEIAQRKGDDKNVRTKEKSRVLRLKI